MAHRAHLRLLLTLVVSFAALFALYGAKSARADSIVRNAASVARNATHALHAPQCRAHGIDSRVLVNGPPGGANLAATLGQWTDDDDPDDILQAESVSIALPPLTSGFGRRVGHAIARECLVSAAFPRGPPSL
jgi:hypothetical protein